MLVSSIGYVNTNKVSHSEPVVNNNQSAKTSLAEGFGHFNENDSVPNNDTNFFKAVYNSLKSLFVKDSSNDSSKYLSLIA